MTRAAQELVFLLSVIVLTAVNVVAGLQCSHGTALRADGCGEPPAIVRVASW